MLNVLLFGASVTQQGYNSGYATYLINSPAFSSVRQYGVGGCHFNDAGYYLLHEAIGDGHYDICLLDWNSTWLGEFDEIKLTSVFTRLLKLDILPFVVILPTKQNNKPRQAEQLVTHMCDCWKIPFLDLRPGFRHDAMLRDDYHTNDVGAAFIAEALIKRLSGLDVTLTLQLIHGSRHSPSSEILLTQVKVGKAIGLAYSLSIGIQQVSSQLPVDLTIDMTIGPFSSYMGIRHDGVSVSTYQIWDQWCHYERRKLFQIINIPAQTALPHMVELFLEPGIIDYSLCRRQGFSFEGEHELRIDTIYGSNLILSQQIKD